MSYNEDISAIFTSQLNYDKLSPTYFKSNELTQVAFERLFNPTYNKNILEIDYPVKKICCLLKSKKIHYKNLQHKFKINPQIIDTFIKTLIDNIDLFADDDLIFSDRYIPSILIYNKDFINKLLQIKACNVFIDYKSNYPDSFLLDDIDINRSALTHYCYDMFCPHNNILKNINSVLLPELFNDFLEKHPRFIRQNVDELIDDLDIDIDNEQIDICLTNCPSLHNFLLTEYELSDEYTTFEYIINLIDKGIHLENIFIPSEIQSPEIYLKAVIKNGLNIGEVPDEFINDELIRIALSNNKFSILQIPDQFIKNKKYDELFDSIEDVNILSNMKFIIDKKSSNFSEQNQLIIKGPYTSIYKDKVLCKTISDLFKVDRDFLLKYGTFRNDFSGLLNIEEFINDYEVLSLMEINDYIKYSDLDKSLYLNYLITQNKRKQINELLPYIDNFSIEIMYNLAQIDKNYVIRFHEKYWDGVILNKYEQYLIKNTKKYMYLIAYLKSKSIDYNFIVNNVLTLLTINYEYVIL